ncbi:MAG: hypothetical protein AAGC55_05190, partial [Myxococcota bacterium]
CPGDDRHWLFGGDSGTSARWNGSGPGDDDNTNGGGRSGEVVPVYSSDIPRIRRWAATSGVVQPLSFGYAVGEFPPAVHPILPDGLTFQ